MPERSTFRRQLCSIPADLADWWCIGQQYEARSAFFGCRAATPEPSKPKRKLGAAGRAAIVVALKKPWKEEKAAVTKVAPTYAFFGEDRDHHQPRSPESAPMPQPILEHIDFNPALS
jgi:hypothetical protein